MASKSTKPTAKVARLFTMASKSKKAIVRLRPYEAIGEETKAKIIKDFEGGKSITALALQSDLSCYLITTILKKRNEVTEAVEGSSPTRCTGLSTITLN